MNYYVRSDLEPYVGQDISYIAYVYPMGTSATDDGGRYYDERDEVHFHNITDRCVIITQEFGTEDKKYTEEILIPIEHIIAFRVFKEPEK